MTEKSDAADPSDIQPGTGADAAGPAKTAPREAVIEYRPSSQDYVLTGGGEPIQISDSRAVLEDYAKDNGITVKKAKNEHP